MSLTAIADLDTFVATREALHQVAEHVLARVSYEDHGSVELEAFESGFATRLLADGRRVRVRGLDLVIDHGQASRSRPLTTVADAAAFVGVAAGFPTELYAPATPLTPEAPLVLDAVAAKVLADWFDLTARVLQRFAEEIAAAGPSPLVLWPEHFDVAFFTDEQNHANYGASPGDLGCPEPYLYVGPWEPVASATFWNAQHFNGAVLRHSELAADPDPSDAALEFLRRGRALLNGS